MATRYDIFSPIFSTNGLTSFWSCSQTLTPMKFTSGCFFWSSVR